MGIVPQRMENVIWWKSNKYNLSLIMYVYQLKNEGNSKPLRNKKMMSKMTTIFTSNLYDPKKRYTFSRKS